MWVAYAFLVSDGIARNDGFAVIYGGKCIAVVTYSHKQRVGRIVEIRKEVGAHVFFGEHFLWSGFSLN